MNNNTTADLGSGSIGKLLFRLALPAITAQIVNVLYNMIDRMYIGHIPEVGATALTGMGVCLPLIVVISAFGALSGMGGAPRAAIKMGQQDNEEAERILGNCTTGTILFGIILTVVFRLFSDDLLMVFGASENTFPYASAYMHIYSCGTLFVLISLGLNSFISTQGFATVSMLSTLIGAVSNIILDPILIFGLNMGVEGAALATIISQAFSAIWILHFLSGRKTKLKIRKKNLYIHLKTYLPCMALGLSPFIMQSTESLISICFNTSLLKYGGDVAVGSMTILSSVMQFSMLPLQGLTQGAQPIISYNYGAKNADRIRDTFFLLLKSCLLYSSLLWAIAIFAPQIFVAIFTSDPALTAYAKWSMRIYMSMSLIFGAQIACQQTFLALGNAKTSLFLAILRKIILLVPLIFILPHCFADKVMAVFLAEPVADTLAVATTVTMFAIQFRQVLKELRTSREASA